MRIHKYIHKRACLHIRTGGKGKYNSRIKFSFNKTGAETEVRTKLSFGENCAENNGTPISSLSKLKLDSDDNNDNSQQSINKASRTSSACKENVNSNTGTTLAPFNDEEEAALKKEKKRIKFSVFNGVQIIPARKELKLQYALDQLREEEEGGEEDFDTELVNGSNYDHYNPETFEHEGEEDGEYSSDEDDNDAQRQQQEHEYGYDYGHEQDRENEEDDDEDAHVFVDNDDDLVEFYCDEDAEERDDGGDDDVFVHMDENETTGVEEEREEEEMIRGIVI